MKKFISIIYCLISFNLYAQNATGVVFVNAGKFDQILKQAKAENKNIFIDAYATWCGPCKKMDSDVYTDDSIGKFINQNFIAIKIQMDQTPNDSRYIKNWYADAKKLQDKYHVEAFPSFIFLSPVGELNYKSEGYHDKEHFMSLLKTANDPKGNYAGLIRRYKRDEILAQDLLPFSLQAKLYHDDSLASDIARRYKIDFLDRSIPSDVLNAELVQFLGVFYDLFSFNDKIIKYMYENQLKADSALKIKGYSQRVIDYIITRDEINPVIKPAGDYSRELPDWNTLEKKLAKNYDTKLAKRLIINSKLGWYNFTKDWPNIVKYNIQKIEDQGLDTVGIGKSIINNMVYDVIFQHSDDSFALNKGIEYIEIILKSSPTSDSWLDTYANLLYKNGRRGEALIHEENALGIAKKRNDNGRIREYEEVLSKMRSNLPTWSNN